MTLFFSCTKENIPESDNKYAIYYATNNKLASERLSSIMYNLEDSIHPVERFKIIHISDPHLSKWSNDNHFEKPNNLIEVVKFSNQSNLKINLLVATGDFIGNNPETTKQEAISYLTSFTYHFYNANRIPSFACTGNHDTNMLAKNPNEYLSKKDLYDISLCTQRNFIHRPEGENYYYTDIIEPTQKTIRLITLDMTDQTTFNYDTQHDAILSQKQINWLCNTALQKDMTNKHSVIILFHYPLQPFSKNGSTFLCDGDFVHPWNMVPEIIEAFRKKERLQCAYENKIYPNFPIYVQTDFSSAPGEFICYLGGHAHVTAQFQIDGLTNQSTILPRQNMLLCTNQSPSEIGVRYNMVPREKLSVSSNSFCIYAIDTKQKKIYITFFGAYKPLNSTEYPDIQEITYI